MAKKRTTRSSDTRKSHPTEEQLIACLRGKSKVFSDIELRALFGDELDEMRQLAQQSGTRGRTRGAAPKVYLLHGIMGSELGIGRALWWDDVIWLGPIDILTGQLRKLRIGDGGDPRVEALGFLPGVYLKMRLHLESEGYEVISHWYDWRQDISSLGKELKARVEKERKPVSIVAHSMGGLVTRAAIKQGMKNFDRFIMLAVPNHGSLAPVEAMRGQYELANWIASADPINDGQELAQDVFCTFPGLHQMILHNSLHVGLDLHKLSGWPQQGPRPEAKMLALADSIQDLLARPEDTKQPWYLIAGVGIETKVRARVKDDEFQYDISTEGDGTVPLESALLEGAKTWYAMNAGHGFFANVKLVRKATVDILRTGETSELDHLRPRVTRAARTITESQLQAAAKVRTSTRGQGASFLQKAGAILGQGTTSTGGAASIATPDRSFYVHRLQHVTIGRRRARRLEVQLYNGSITDVDARAYVLGTFTGVAPSGAMLALDRAMDGALTELIGGNMFGSRTGEVFILPLARRSLSAETAVFVGLGAYDEFKTVPVPAMKPEGDRPLPPTSNYINEEHVPVLEIAGENAMRTLARTYVEDFATVILGGTLCSNEMASGESLLRGFLRGLDLSDPRQKMRRITICEINVDRYRAIRDHLFFLASTPLCAGIELDIDELPPLPPMAQSMPVTRAGPRAVEPVYLTVRAMPVTDDRELWRFTPLGTGTSAAIREAEREISPKIVEDLLKAVPNGGGREPEHFTELSRAITREILPPFIVEELKARSDRPLVILHDASRAARIPWESLLLPDAASPVALSHGLTRRLIASRSECSRWSTPSQPGQRINVLIIGDPREDLPSAEQEAKNIASKLSKAVAAKLSAKSLFSVDVLMQSAATRSAILEKLKSGNYDIVHYSGHAEFDDQSKSSCLKVADGIIKGDDLGPIPRLPFLMMLNACESARTRAGKKGSVTKPKKTEIHSIAETLMCSGIANFVGTYWEVFDDSACDFAVELYTALVGGDTLGKAMLDARTRIKDTADWANYELFGNPDARLRQI